jgi:hypothetical protein
MTANRIRSLLVVLLLLLSQQQTPTALLTGISTGGRRTTGVHHQHHFYHRLPPPPPLSMVALRTTPTDNEHELKIGHALDTLRADYQTLLTANPDFSLYDENIEVVDPSGVKLHGLRNYKAAFNFIHALLRVVYCPAQSSLSYRMCYDKARSNIRISWNAKIVPRIAMGVTPHYIDGISVYEMNLESGQITQHRIERLLLNDRHVAPKEGVIERLRAEHGVVVPSFYGSSSSSSSSSSYGTGGVTSSSGGGGSGPGPLSPSSSMLSSRLYHHHHNKPSGRQTRSARTVLHALEASDRGESDFTNNNSNAGGGVVGIDLDALESRNRSRKKFGLKPLRPEEFHRLQQEIDVLSDETTRKIARAAEEREMVRQQQLIKQQQQQRGPGLFEKAMGALTDTCETNFDCERPQVCCDFIFQRRCCSSGALVGREMPRLVPVPADNPSYDSQGPRMRPRPQSRY